MKTFSLHKTIAESLRKSAWLFALVVCIALCCSQAQAQTVEFTQNPAGNHAMTLQVPLADYPGRGVSLPVTLKYSSQGLWRVGFLNSIQLSGNVRRSCAEAVYAEHSTAGWTTSLDVPKVEWPRQNDVYWYTGKSYAQGTVSGKTFRVAKLFVHMPGGSTLEMRKADAVYADNGTIDMVGTFYAIDGSRMRYDSTGPNTGTLYLPDGSRYVLGGSTVQYIDINGNLLNYNISNRQWTDTMGRLIGMPWPVNPGAGDYTYSLPGFDLPYTLKFRSLSDVLSPDAQSLRPMADYFLYFPNELPSGSNFPQATGAPALFTSGYSDDSEPPSPSSYTYVVGRGQPQNSLFNPTVLAEIVMPNGQSYKFSYNHYGELDRVFYPTGGYQRYEYSAVPAIGVFSVPYVQGSRGIISRWLSPNGIGGVDEAQWQYSKSTSPMIVTAPDGTRTEIYLFYPTSFFSDNFGYEDSRLGAPYEERVYAPTSQGGAMLRRTITEFAETTLTINKPKVQGISNPGTYTAHRNARPMKTVNLILDTGASALAQTITYEYVSNGFEFKSGLDRTATTETNFAPVDQTTAQTSVIGSIPVGTTIRRTETTYLNTSAYQSRNILGLPTTGLLKGVVNGTLQVVSRSETFYDEAAYPLMQYTDLVGDQGYLDPGSPIRGNPTTVRSYLNLTASVAAGLECPAGVCLNTHAQFDQIGHLVNGKNQRGIQSQTEYSETHKHAYATKSTTAVPDPSGSHGSNVAFTSSSTFDTTTGQLLRTIDANGQVTSFSYTDDSGNRDPLHRLRKVTRPDDGWTKYSFGETVGNLFTLIETRQDATITTKSYQYFDPLGRLSRSFVSEGDDNYIAIDKIYDQLGRTSKVSNPYRTAIVNGVADLSHTNEWTTSRYEALGRLDLVTFSDGSIVQTDYQGIYTTVTDSAGKQRRQKIDALGRMIRVDEPNSSGSLGTEDLPIQSIFYQYDAYGNPVAISQGLAQPALNPEDPSSYLQHRYFKYDALGRLTNERQVEQAGTFATAVDPLTGNAQWSRKLVYDETIGGVTYTGLLTSTYDARNIQDQLRYDNLNRIYQITYSDGTPTVTHNYDQARGTYSNKGHLTEALTEASGTIPQTAQVYNFDLMGRVVNHQQTVGAQTYTLNYGYNLGGTLIGETYPSGRVVSYALDEGGRLSQVASGSKIYANQFDYQWLTGSLKSVTLGNGTVETYSYNSRMQVQSLDLSKSGTQIQHYDYKYGVYDPATHTVDETRNNGQIAQIESFVGTQKQWQQRFAYDSLNRLASTREFRGDNTQQSYLVNYDYDVFGNRYQKQAQNVGNPFSQIWVEAGQIDQATNRFNTGVSYDAAGNVTIDSKFRSRQLQYDAKDRQKQSANLDLSGAVDSVYDAAGQRVATQVGGSLTNVLVYDSSGKLVAEYNATPANNGTQYVFGDHQNTPRTITDTQGQMVSRHDYLPFGEELGAVGMRASVPGYGGTDTTRQKYAGMETDEATGMAHTLWRKYDSYSGRWTSPDPYGGSMMFADPQTFNRYTYVNNDPVNQTDPTGLMPMLADASTSWSDVADGFWGSSFGGPRRENHIAEGMARHDSLLATGYDTAFGIFRGEVEVRYTPDSGGYSITSILTNPTPEELAQKMDSMTQSDQLVAQNGGRPKDPKEKKDPDVNAVNAALGAGSTAASVGQYSNVNGEGTAWKAANGKWYRMGWGGNGATGPRASAVARSGSFAVLSKTLSVAGAGFSLFQGVQGYRAGKGKSAIAKGTLDAGMALVGGFGGPYGAAAGAIYFVLDTYGWQNCLDKAMNRDPYGVKASMQKQKSANGP